MGSSACPEGYMSRIRIWTQDSWLLALLTSDDYSNLLITISFTLLSNLKNRCDDLQSPRVTPLVSRAGTQKLPRLPSPKHHRDILKPPTWLCQPSAHNPPWNQTQTPPQDFKTCMIQPLFLSPTALLTSSLHSVCFDHADSSHRRAFAPAVLSS